MSNIYREAQRGGLCRKHALNAYFGNAKLSVNDFNQKIKEFELYMKEMGFSGETNVKSFDIFHSSQESIISYVLDKLGNSHSLLLQIGHVQEYLRNRQVSLDDLIGSDCEFVFVFNKGHIWGVRKVKEYRGKTNQWIIVDSLKNLSVLTPNFHKRFANNKNHGLIIPRSLRETIKDFIWQISKIKEIIGENITAGLLNVHKKHKSLNNVEILLSLSFRCYHYIFQENNERELLNKFINWRKLYENDKTNEEYISTILPDIITELFNKYNNLINAINNK